MKKRDYSCDQSLVLTKPNTIVVMKRREYSCTVVDQLIVVINSCSVISQINQPEMPP